MSLMHAEEGPKSKRVLVPPVEAAAVKPDLTAAECPSRPDPHERQGYGTLRCMQMHQSFSALLYTSLLRSNGMCVKHICWQSLKSCMTGRGICALLCCCGASRPIFSYCTAARPTPSSVDAARPLSVQQPVAPTEGPVGSPVDSAGESSAQLPEAVHGLLSASCMCLNSLAVWLLKTTQILLSACCLLV